MNYRIGGNFIKKNPFHRCGGGPERKSVEWGVGTDIKIYRVLWETKKAALLLAISTATNQTDSSDRLKCHPV